jgi:hypothetical protein
VKRKRESLPSTPELDIVVPEALLEQALRATEAERPYKAAACVVCSGECPANAVEGLCWVCRRLKLSAWRDSDSQMPMQE